MDTAPLKSFATSARTELIREVGARITAVLAQGSPERIEQPGAVKALERAIARAGSADNGKAHVADKVAYTWFNRIIALRFMDANSYTGIGVVSPAADQVGQPEVLAAAKRGQIDGGVVRGTDAATIAGLLNGTRQPRTGVDAQAEAYALLLTDYCRYWNSAMPFIFEREGDYTELLIPANLLADDSALSRSVKVLTEDVCHDVEVIGWLYQFYISERKDEVFAGFKKNKKADADEIPSATQLFTPHWIVRYLVENSVGRLWMLNHPESRLVDQMDYYIAPVAEEIDFLEINGPEDLTVIDPACGSGHMLTYAFELLYAIYEEEGYTPSQIPGLILTNNLFGTEIDPRAGALAAFALTMKAAAKRKLFLKNAVEPNICVLDPITFAPYELDYLVTEDGDRQAEVAFWNQFAEADTFGSLVRPVPELTSRLSRHLVTLEDSGDLLRANVIDRAGNLLRQAKVLTADYAAVVANPPYMSSGNMCSSLSEMARRAYPRTKANLYAMFIERCLDLASFGGVVGMITMESWMFLGSYVALRNDIRRANTLLSMAHLGAGAFDSISGEVVATCAFVILKAPGGATKSAFIRLVDAPNEAIKASILRSAAHEPSHPHRYAVDSKVLVEIPGGIYAYWLQKAAIRAFALGTVRDHAKSEGAVKTGDNARFLRKHWEVNRRDVGAQGGWRLHPKGGGFRRWYGNVETVVDWTPSARAHYRKDRIARIPASEFWDLSGITWSSVSTTRASFRILEADEIANNAALFIFLNDEARTYPVLGYLNSRFAAEYLEAVAPTINYLVGDIMTLPLPKEFIDEASLRSNVATLVAAARETWDELEISVSFSQLPLLTFRSDMLEDAVAQVDRRRGERAQLVRDLELANEAILSLTFGHMAAPLAWDDVVDPETTTTSGDQVRDLVSYAVGCMFGRYSLDEPDLILGDQGSTLDDYLAKVPHPTFAPDADNVIPIVDGDWFEDDIVERFRQFLRVAFGEQHFEENLRFVTDTVSSITGIRTLRDYFIKTTARGAASRFYDDHVQRYKKRPIYWLFSSPKGSFNALVYLHRYRPSMVSTVLTYLREYVTKLESALQQAERAGNAKEADRLRKILVELNEYEHDTLYPKASENVIIDLDDGVKANYPKFGAALKKIPGLEAASD
ncbi:BREX-1 system adenine-specific DNA-methyltransferase PglX [Nocardia salmonicida]|uniref:BREX-1 system adenine-specific DNA-methyltransferase PglX n=1 Tax=Nocardia salmonicida TaxID=53431 RepID=UPI002E2BA513|nr:BREX-1 system adenine-specific DNA-methyltransferase PglX [Nocardia salmonicida]